MNKLLISLLLAAAAVLSGCTAQDQAAFMEGYNRGAIVRNQILQGLGNALVAYGNGVSEYEVTHPTVYVQPQHGTMTVITPGEGTSFIYY
jgi:hypothetical protein